MPELPVVTVLMSVHNDRAFVAQAVDSVLSQTFVAFEFLVIDDGSTDGSADVLAAARDARMIVHRNDANLGLTRSLRRGVEWARGRYIARLDADDVACPERLAIQVDFLERHPDVGIVGSACRLIDEQGTDVGLVEAPRDDLSIRWRSLITNPMLHPTVMVRRDLLNRHNLNYDESVVAAQDYDLWMRLLRHTRGANLVQALVKYRVHSQSVTSRNRAVQLQHQDLVALRTIREQLPDFEITLEQVGRLRTLFGEQRVAPEVASDRVGLSELYLNLLGAFERRHSGEDCRVIGRREALTVARMALRPPLLSGWQHLVRRLLGLNPALPGVLAIRSARMIGRRMKRQVTAGRGARE